MKKCIKKLCNLFLIMMSVAFVSNSAIGVEKTHTLGMSIQHQCDYENECSIGADSSQTCSVENLGLADPVDFYADFCPACYYKEVNGELVKDTDMEKSVNCTEVLTCPEMPEVNVEETCSGLSGTAFAECANNAMETAMAEAEANRCSYETSCKTGYENIKNNGQPDAYCDIITYTITYNNMDGAVNSPNNPATYTVEDSITFEDASKTGYTFDGWFLDSGYLNEITEITKGTTGNKVLYAKWSANDYVVKYDANNGSGVMLDTSCIYDEDCTLSSNLFTRVGYEFDGWNTKTDGSGTDYSDGETQVNFTDESEITMFAKWKLISYDITYDVGCGANELQSADIPTKQYDVENTNIVLPNPTRDNYTFVGWCVSTDESCVPTKGTYVVPSGQTGGIIFNAVWTPVKIQITYHYNDTEEGQTEHVESDMCTVGQTFTLPAEEPTRNGYKFMGWRKRKSECNYNCVPTQTMVE